MIYKFDPNATAASSAHITVVIRDPEPRWAHGERMLTPRLAGIQFALFRTPLWPLGNLLSDVRYALWRRANT